MTKPAFIVLAAIAALAPALARTPAPALAIRGGRVIDGSVAAPLLDVVISVEGDLIARMGPRGSAH